LENSATDSTLSKSQLKEQTHRILEFFAHTLTLWSWYSLSLYRFMPLGLWALWNGVQK